MSHFDISTAFFLFAIVAVICILLELTRRENKFNAERIESLERNNKSLKSMVIQRDDTIKRMEENIVNLRQVAYGKQEA